jgi:hypothetical protein
MARSTRLRNRSTSQKAISLLASGLPAPVQRVAQSSIGSKLLLWGIPALLIAGVLHLDWEGGIPHLSVDRQRAAELEQVAREKLEKINPATIQQWENSARNLWQEAQSSSYPKRQTIPNTFNPSQQAAYQYPPPASYPQSNHQPNYQPTQQPNYQQQYQQPTYAQPTYNQPTYQQPQPYYPQQPTQPPNYQPQQYQSYQQPLQGTWRQ